MKRFQTDSRCPINYTLEILSNRWSFLILRDIVYYNKHTYNDFFASPERITSSMLADRLAALENDGILKKTQSQTDRRKVFYSLTDKGLDLIPILMELSEWGEQHNPTVQIDDTLAKALKNNREKVISLVRETVASGSSVYKGDMNVMDKIKLAMQSSP